MSSQFRDSAYPPGAWNAADWVALSNPEKFMVRGDVESGAIFSIDEKYRFLLWRRWSDGSVLNSAMLNPSKASEIISDPTVTRNIVRAKRLGYGGILVSNLFGWRATDSTELQFAADPVGEYNDGFILAAALAADLVLCGWGSASPLIAARAAHVRRLLSEIPLHYLRMGSKQPWHPLYLPYTEQPKPWL